MNIELGGENTNLHFRLDKTTIYTWQWENSQGLCLDVEVRYDTRYDIVTRHDVLNDNEPKHIIYARLQSVFLLYNTGDAISNPLNFFHNYCVQDLETRYLVLFMFIDMMTFVLLSAGLIFPPLTFNGPFSWHK